jgi:hypothetical protein
VWYKTKRIGLALEFISEVECRWHLNTLTSLPLFAKKFGVSSCSVFQTVFIFGQRNIALLSWQYFTAVETLPFGKVEPKET